MYEEHMFEIKDVIDKNKQMKGIECDVGRGELCCIECPEAVKQILFSILCGYEEITGGSGRLLELQWFNRPLDVKALQFRRFAGIVSEQFGLFEFLTCKQNIMISGLLDNDGDCGNQYEKYEDVFRIKGFSNKMPVELLEKEKRLILLARGFWKNKSLVIINGIFDDLSENERKDFTMLLKSAVNELRTSVIYLTSLKGVEFGIDKKYVFSGGKLFLKELTASI